MSEVKTFKDAYAVLQRHAQTLRSQQEPDIDNLTTIVSESLAAHKVCKGRNMTRSVRLPHGIDPGRCQARRELQVR